MPKEVTHWSISDEIITRISDDKVHKLVKKYRDIFLLGSIFHDMFYYYSGDNQMIKQFPDKLHGANQEDTMSLVRVLNKKYSLAKDGKLKDILYVFKLGLISHICVDTIFHPFIYYFTGNYYDPDKSKQLSAVAKHREIEALIDRIFVHDATCNSSYNIDKLLKMNINDLESIFEKGLNIPDYNIKIDKKTILDSYSNFASDRNIFTSRWRIVFLKIFKPILSDNLKRILELSYYNNTYFFENQIKNEFSYHHPVTNELIKTDLQTLRNNAIDKFLFFISKNDYSDHGESLETGLVNSNANDMKYFKEII